MKIRRQKSSALEHHPHAGEEAAGIFCEEGGTWLFSVRSDDGVQVGCGSTGHLVIEDVLCEGESSFLRLPDGSRAPHYYPKRTREETIQLLVETLLDDFTEEEEMQEGWATREVDRMDNLRRSIQSTRIDPRMTRSFRDVILRTGKDPDQRLVLQPEKSLDER